MPSKDHVYKGRNVMLDDGKRKLIGVPQRSSSKNAESHLPQAWFAAWILSSYRGINALVRGLTVCQSRGLPTLPARRRRLTLAQQCMNRVKSVPPLRESGLAIPVALTFRTSAKEGTSSTRLATPAHSSRPHLAAPTPGSRRNAESAVGPLDCLLSTSSELDFFSPR